MEGTQFMSRTERRKGRGPEFVRWFGPLLIALHDNGGEGTPTQVKDSIAKRERVPDSVLDQTLKNGTSRFGNQVEWAKYYLSRYGYIDVPKRGVWALSENGRKVKQLSHDESLQIFQSIERVRLGKEDTDQSQVSSEPAEAFPEDVPNRYKGELVEALQGLSSDAFERVCARILKHYEYSDVSTTGRTGDGGIDGSGNITLHRFLNFRILFQCKRYVGSVGPERIRDFRGAIDGRCDVGVFFTTGSFTQSARQEATRDGATPIRLVGMEQLVELLEGVPTILKPITTYQFDRANFDDFTREV